MLSFDSNNKKNKMSGLAIDENGNKVVPQLNLNAPRWDQSTYWGRAQHFFSTTNPLNCFASPTTLNWSKDIVTRYKNVRALSYSPIYLRKQGV